MVSSEAICIVPTAALSAVRPPGNVTSRSAANGHPPAFFPAVLPGEYLEQFCRLYHFPALPDARCASCFCLACGSGGGFPAWSAPPPLFPAASAVSPATPGCAAPIISRAGTALFPALLILWMSRKFRQRRHIPSGTNGGLRGRQTAPPALVSGCAGCQSLFWRTSRPITQLSSLPSPPPQIR